jgi:hypothetical protein
LMVAFAGNLCDESARLAPAQHNDI